MHRAARRGAGSHWRRRHNHTSDDPHAPADCDEITTKTAGSGRQLAITDGRTVTSAPTVSQPISGGTVDITFGGDGFSEQDAAELAERIS